MASMANVKNVNRTGSGQSTCGAVRAQDAAEWKRSNQCVASKATHLSAGYGEFEAIVAGASHFVGGSRV
jgi:hypothetical protein